MSRNGCHDAARQGDNDRVAEPDAPQPRHARLTLTQRGVRVAIALGAAALVVGVAAIITVGSAARPTADAPAGSAEPPTAAIPVATALPAPSQTAHVPASCDDPGVAAALAGGSDAEVIAAFGGVQAFRTAVVTGAPCVSLADPARVWVVVDKQRPLAPIDFAPGGLVAPEGVQRVEDVLLRPDAAAALAELVAAAASDGAGTIGLNSAYRSYASQQSTYRGYVRQLGREAADRQSARPGYSEHQTGLAADVTACDPACVALEAFGGTAQAQWVATNGWRFGYIVRYDEGRTAVTGYDAEPWHLRYLGTELAAAYHDGDFHTLEEFFGLPAAPDYAE